MSGMLDDLKKVNNTKVRAQASGALRLVASRRLSRSQSSSMLPFHGKSFGLASPRAFSQGFFKWGKDAAQKALGMKRRGERWGSRAKEARLASSRVWAWPLGRLTLKDMGTSDAYFELMLGDQVSAEDWRAPSQHCRGGL